MEGRTVGSNALYALDSDQTRLSPQLATLLRAGVAAAPAAGEARSAALAYIPAHAAGHVRGSLFALAEEDSTGTHPGAMPAVRSLAESFYSSLCHTGGHALDSAVGTSLEHLRALICRGYNLPRVRLAAAAVQERRLWVTTSGDCGAYLLRMPAGDWMPLCRSTSPLPSIDSSPCARAEVYARPAAPIMLETGDILILGSPGLQARLPEKMLRTCLLALLRSDPRIGAQDMAEIVVRLAASRPGSGEVAALVMRCYGVLAASAALEQGWPAAYRLSAVIPTQEGWDGATPMPVEAGATRATPRPGPVPGAPPSIFSRPARLEAPPTTPARTPTPVARTAKSPEAPGAKPVLSGEAPPPAPAKLPPVAAGVVKDARVPAAEPAARTSETPAWPVRWATPDPVAWLGAAPRLAQVLLPGAGVLVGGGLVSSWLNNNMIYLLGGCSLSGLLLCAAAWPEQMRAARVAPALAAAGPVVDRLRMGPPKLRARSYVPPPRSAASTPRQSATGAIHWAKDRLVLPPTGVIRQGCLDIVNLKEQGGRIVAQLVLLCPSRLLSANGYPGGVYVMLHDLVTDQRRVTAWLAPGERRLETAREDIACYGGNPNAALRWLRGAGNFELASSRLRVTLQIDRCEFADPVRRQHIESLEALVTDVQVLA